MKYYKIVQISREIRKTLGELVTSKNSYFDWEYSGQEESEDDIELGFYWDKLTPEVVSGISEFMKNCPYETYIGAGRHDFARHRNYQVKLVIVIPQK